MSAPSCARAAAFGVAGLIVTDRHAPADTGVLAKAASGALEIVPLVRAVNLARALEQLKEAGFWLYGLDERGDAAIDDARPRGPRLHRAGRRGRRPAPADRREMRPAGDNSDRGQACCLNVSNAAAVAAYEWARRRTKSS